VEVQVILTALGQRIRELRAKKGYSQEAFADLCGVHRTFMGTVERGESNLSFTNLAKIAKALEITLSQMLSGLEKRTDTVAKKPSKKG
jgi:transcriptional regulator with XRE-family HTH domain